MVRHVVLAQATRLAHAIGLLFDTSKCKDERSEGLRQGLDVAELPGDERVLHLGARLLLNDGRAYYDEWEGYVSL